MDWSSHLFMTSPQTMKSIFDLVGYTDKSMYGIFPMKFGYFSSKL